MGIDLSKVSLKDIHGLLSARGQTNRFLSDRDREDVITWLNHIDYGYVYDERGAEMFEDMCNTSFSFDVSMDIELIEYLTQRVQDQDEWHEEEEFTLLDKKVRDIIASSMIEAELLDQE